MKQIMPIAKAQEVAKQFGGDLLDVIMALVEQGWEAVEMEAVEVDGDWQVFVREPSGVIVAFMLPEWVASNVAVPGGESLHDLHITLNYLGEASAMSLDQQRKLVGVVAEVAQEWQGMSGHLKGTGRFDGEEEDAFWVGVDVPELKAFQAALQVALIDNGLTEAPERPYRPHVTVAYLDKDTETPSIEFNAMEVWFDTVTVCVGANRFPIKMKEIPQGYEDAPRGGWVPNTVAKSADTELRYTFGPMYIPGQLDAHNEYTDSKELQKALWGYVQRGDRRIRKQHNVDVVAGEWVEAVSWPQEVTLDMTQANGVVKQVTFPANTPFLGVIWNEEAWEEVKAGKLTGYSIGGTANMLEVDLGDDE